ncbi:vetispiradiene synthase 2-like protein [Carex littledalei]|uniref:Vetispiradiene synthase 2-like protein n=1 Tax=Carex littledalei TaxID=544730 RepID=A0A833VFI0_9POAL|nr:vetispiradiene synthase 2-like protein [Carex littledalei]
MFLFQRESKSGQGPTTFDCYKIEHKLTDEETTVKFQSFCEDAWKRLNQACLCPADGRMTVLEQLVNQGRQMETFYVYFNDGFNKTSNLKKITRASGLRAKKREEEEELLDLELQGEEEEELSYGNGGEILDLQLLDLNRKRVERSGTWSLVGARV